MKSTQIIYSISLQKQFFWVVKTCLLECLVLNGWRPATNARVSLLSDYHYLQLYSVAAYAQDRPTLSIKVLLLVANYCWQRIRRISWFIEAAARRRGADVKIIAIVTDELMWRLITQTPAGDVCRRRPPAPQRTPSADTIGSRVSAIAFTGS